MLFKDQRRYVFAVLVLTLAFGGLPARAHARASAPPPGAAVVSAPATDVVNLKNGGMVRGQIVELLPDDSLTVVSAATGEATRYAWAELASFERAGTTTDVSAVDTGPRFGALQATAGAPRLHIELTRPADLKLFEVTGTISMMNFKTGFSSGETYRPVCVAPCDQVIDGRRGQSFFFNGDGVIKSRKFSLSGRSGDVVARVKPGRAGLRVGGVVVMSLGGVALGTSAMLFLLADRGLRKYDDMGQALPREPNYLPATALLTSGALLAAGGLAMVLLSRTRIKWSQRTAAARLRLGLG